MAERTTRVVVHFSSPFFLPNFDGPEPAGDYRVDFDENSLETSGGVAWRRVGAFFHLPAIGKTTARFEMIPVYPADLDAALEKDRNP